MSAPVLIGSEIYRGSSYGAWHPLAIPRVSTVLDLARALGWLSAANYRTSPRARPAALTAWHSPAYIDALQRAEIEGAVDPETRARHGLGTTANPVFPEMFRRPATGAGGALLAADLPQRIVHVPGAGTHHALADRANGFCYINDPVLCLLRLRALGYRRIAYVDIDAHHCDGVQAALGGAPDMLLISVHEQRRWPFPGALDDDGGGNALNLPVPPGFHDAEMAAVRDRLILPALDRFQPDALVLQCGADAVAEDPLSRLALTNAAHADMARALAALGVKLIAMGGGGYNPWSVARCWVRVWGALNGWEVPGDLPDAAQAVLSALTWPGRAAGRNPPAHWSARLNDPPAPPLPVRPEVAIRIDALRARLAIDIPARRP